MNTIYSNLYCQNQCVYFVIIQVFKKIFVHISNIRVMKLFVNS